MTTGSRKQAQRVCGPRSERDDEVLERLEKPVGTAKRCFRVKVVGSNPAGPTKNLFDQNNNKGFHFSEHYIKKWGV
jgi:hypothetical protein